MNQYGRQIQQHWINHRPIEMSQLTDPTEFFTEQGELAAQEIEQRAQQLQTQHAAEQPPGESYLALLGQLNTARMMAEDEVLRTWLTVPEQETDLTDG